jgi:acyl carrier protein
MSKEIEQTLEKIFIIALDIKRNNFIKLKKSKNIDLDSLSYMTLVNLIEKKFKIKLKKNDFFNLKSFKKTLVIIKKYIK